ncbi:MAG TPA: gephyrin-like molybdotransferase Glp [Spirochaetia bacterium]|nr:gephyrin-like molybdotransferase Glp [Spirochaetia bacterium]
MIELDKAFEIISQVPPRVRAETVTLDRALGRVLAHDVHSPLDSPPFSKSAMDGFAVRSDDDSVSFRVVDMVAAGGRPRHALAAGECARIMTGAMLPPGAGRIIRKELVDETDGTIQVLGPETGDNVIPQGSNLRAGDTVLTPRVLSPQDIGILAASGFAAVDVVVPPSVSIISTGSEIRTPGETLGPGEIYNSNAPQLAAQLARLGCPSRFLGVVADQPEPLSRSIESALGSSELVLLTGGVSAGDFDFVPRCLAERGAEVLFHGVSVKPGKPTLMARRGARYVFGLPGNPVSTFVIFEIFVKPFLLRWMGLDWGPRLLRARLGARVHRRGTERTEFLPVSFRDGRVIPVAYHGSAHLNALADADGLIRVEKGVATLEEGDEVDVRPL